MSIETKHTPGQWAIFHSLHGRNFDSLGRIAGTELPWFICPATDIDKIFGVAIDPIKDREYAQVICGFGADYRHKSDEEIWANAHLIKTAPDLLAALELLLFAADGIVDRKACDRARAAIARSGGGKP